MAIEIQTTPTVTTPLVCACVVKFGSSLFFQCMKSNFSYTQQDVQTHEIGCVLCWQLFNYMVVFIQAAVLIKLKWMWLTREGVAGHPMHPPPWIIPWDFHSGISRAYCNVQDGSLS